MTYESQEIQEYVNQYLPKKYPLSNEYKMRQRIYYVKKALDILNTTRLDISNMGEFSELIYAYAIKRKMSPKYLVAILGQLNSIRDFFEIKNREWYRKVVAPNAHYTNKIKEAYSTSKTKRKCYPLTTDLLRQLKTQLRPGTYNFLYIAFFLGLRPAELLACKKNKKTYKIRHIDGHKTLLVYQSKLHLIEKEKRWKYIPLLEVEQMTAVKLLELDHYTRPCAKTLLKTLLSDKAIHLTLYSARKGFAPMMLQRGYKLEDISKMLGHKNISMTLKSYTDNKSVQEAWIKTIRKEK